MGFSRSELESFRDATLDDLVPADLKLLFVGINPGLWTVATQTHFAYPGNRFYPALRLAGIAERDLVWSSGMSDTDRDYLAQRGVGITNVVARATARADELTKDELRAGAERLTQFVTRHRPRVVAIAGITAYRTAFGKTKAKSGRQEDRIADRPLWIVPNPSGLNARETVASLAAAYREPAIEAGILELGNRW